MAKNIAVRSVNCEADFFLLHHLPHVNEGISHPAKGRVNTNICYISYFLEAKS